MWHVEYININEDDYKSIFSLNQLFNHEIRLLQQIGTHISANYGVGHGRGVHCNSTTELPENEAQ